MKYSHNRICSLTCNNCDKVGFNYVPKLHFFV